MTLLADDVRRHCPLNEAQRLLTRDDKQVEGVTKRQFQQENEAGCCKQRAKYVFTPFKVPFMKGAVQLWPVDQTISRCAIELGPLLV